MKTFGISNFNQLMQIVLDYASVASQTIIWIDKDSKINKKLFQQNFFIEINNIFAIRGKKLSVFLHVCKHACKIWRRWAVFVQGDHSQ